MGLSSIASASTFIIGCVHASLMHNQTFYSQRFEQIADFVATYECSGVRNLILTGRGSRTAPAALQQMRYCVLQCIGQLASIGTGRTVWKGMTDKVAEAIAPYLDNAQASAVKEAAAQASAA